MDAKNSSTGVGLICRFDICSDYWIFFKEYRSTDPDGIGQRRLNFDVNLPQQEYQTHFQPHADAALYFMRGCGAA